MPGKISMRNIAEHHSRNYTILADRGGLYHVEELVYYLFVLIELIVGKELSAIFKEKGRGLEKVKKENLSWVCDNEEIQFV